VADNGRTSTILGRMAQAWDTTIHSLSPPAKEEAAPPKPSYAEIRDLTLRQWARTTPPEFFEWLDELIAFAAQEAREAVDSHGRLARATGAGDALSIIKTQFSAWIGTSHRAPDTQ